MKSESVFHVEKKTEFEKLSCFFVDFLRYSFWRIIKVILTVIERQYHSWNPPTKGEGGRGVGGVGPSEN